MGRQVARTRNVRASKKGLDFARKTGRQGGPAFARPVMHAWYPGLQSRKRPRHVGMKMELWRLLTS